MYPDFVSLLCVHAKLIVCSKQGWAYGAVSYKPRQGVFLRKGLFIELRKDVNECTPTVHVNWALI